MRFRFARFAASLITAIGLAMGATIGCVGPAVAATASTTMLVTASVAQSCSVGAAPLAFGIYSGRQLDAASAVQAACSNGTGYQIAVDSSSGGGPGERRLTGTGDDVHAPLSYAIYADTARNRPWGATAGVDTVAGTGTGDAQSIPIFGRIPANQSPGNGDYQDVVRITIIF